MSELFDGVTQEAWLAELEKTRLDLRKYLYALWAIGGTPGKLLDIGCGNGDLVMVCRQLGIQAFGIDQLNLEETDIYMEGVYFTHDLRTPFNLTEYEPEISTVDMVLCWEVAEHIPEEYHNILADTCANHLHRSGFWHKLIFTSAHPGQGGTEHVAARPAQYWREMFHKRGLNYLHEHSIQLAAMWRLINGPCYWLPANVQVFERS
jgi:cyclopropane fatty-acyl-phospholipid synthase-like methyltransferase